MSRAWVRAPRKKYLEIQMDSHRRDPGSGGGNSAVPFVGPRHPAQCPAVRAGVWALLNEPQPFIRGPPDECCCVLGTVAALSQPAIRAAAFTELTVRGESGTEDVMAPMSVSCG